MYNVHSNKFTNTFYVRVVWDEWSSWTPCKHTKTGPQRRRFSDLNVSQDSLEKYGYSEGIDLYRMALPIVSNNLSGINTTRITDIIENENFPKLPRLFQVEQCIGERKYVINQQ